MATAAHEDYLITQVMTAPPQRLQLMLIEAALRNMHACRRHWQENQAEAACEAMIRAQEIVTELLSNIRIDQQQELTRRVAGVYLFVFRTLVRAQIEQSDQRLGEALEVLEIERDTWRAVCEQLGVDETAPAMHGASFEA